VISSVCVHTLMSQVCYDTCFWFVSRLFDDSLLAREVIDGRIIFCCDSERAAKEVCSYVLEYIKYSYEKYQDRLCGLVIRVSGY
jgi:hypothetical protein